LEPLRRFEPRGRLAGALVKKARDLGVVTRALPNADTISFSPPFVVTESELDQMVAGTRQALDEACRELGLA
jgi:L-2,4-diaminobutyrate transaminase